MSNFLVLLIYDSGIISIREIRYKFSINNEKMMYSMNYYLFIYKIQKNALNSIKNRFEV